MPRVESLKLLIETGAAGHAGPIQVEFNGHVLPVSVEEGSASPSSRYVASYAPHSMAHSLRLLGPEHGPWSIDRARVTIDTGLEPYSVEFEPFELRPGQAASLWSERPAEPFDV